MFLKVNFLLILFLLAVIEIKVAKAKVSYESVCLLRYRARKPMGTESDMTN